MRIRSHRKNGPPTQLVTIPIGNSAGNTTNLDTMSAIIINVAPNRIDPGKTILLSLPIKMRIRCGVTSPIKPIIQVIATEAPVRRATVKIISIFVLSTENPIWKASRSPRSKAFRFLDKNISKVNGARIKKNKGITLTQVIPPRLQVTRNFKTGGC